MIWRSLKQIIKNFRGLDSFCGFLRLGVLVFFFISPLSSLKAEDSFSIIRDAEIEAYLRDLATPVFQAAGINPDSVSLVIIQNNTLNAFVAGGMNEFFYTGLLQASETPEQLLGVIAHETGHMAAGHLVRGTEAMKNASTQAIIGVLLGAAAGIATGNGNVAMGALSGAQAMAERSFLSYSRMQESAADTAALSYLDRMGTTSKGLFEFMKKLGAQDILSADRKTAYARTHPLSQDRIDYIGHHLESSSLIDRTLSEDIHRRHARMKAKLMGFLQPKVALLRYTDKDKRVDARYARAIALYRSNQLARALSLMDSLILEEPRNPFFLELKGQALFESGRVDEAVGVYRKAVDLLPRSPLLRIAYAHALLEAKTQTDQRLETSIQNLLDACRIENRNPEAWRLLASAFGQRASVSHKAEDSALVSYALAEEALLKDEDKNARLYAERALKTLPSSSPYYLRAQDIKLSIKKDAPSFLGRL